MQQACKSVEEGELSIRRAAESFDIPRSTLYDRISGKVAIGSRSGPPCYLNDAEEGELVNFILGCSKVGYSRSRKQVIALAQQIAKEKGMEVSVTSGWWVSFRKRHPELTLRMSEPLAHVRAASVSPEVLDKYYDVLDDTLRSNELIDKPCQIFNCDETGMPLAPHPPRVVARKGVKHSTAITSGDKSQITVLACCSAGGCVIPPFVIFDRKSLKPEMTNGEIPGTMYGCSSSGWIDSELFDLWFTDHFLAYAPPTRPLLLLDGHSSHFEPAVICKAAEEKVTVFCLPPHTTHVTQPLDSSCFGSLKKMWVEECHRYLCENPGRVITRYQFSALFHRAWVRGMTMLNVISGFRSTGVFPLNRKALAPAAKPPPKPRFNPASLAERTGLQYIPLYSPARRSQDTPQPPAFTAEEISHFQRRFEEGYNLSIDPRYNQWLCMYHPDTDLSSPVSPYPENPPEDKLLQLPAMTESDLSRFQRRYEGFDLTMDPKYNQWLQVYHPNSNSTPSPPATPTSPSFSQLPPDTSALVTVSSATQPQYSSAILARVLKYPTPTIKNPTSRPKSSGRVLNSSENIRIVEAKEKKKQEEAESKKKRQQERKEKVRKKQEEAERKRKEREEKIKQVALRGMSVLYGIVYYVL